MADAPAPASTAVPIPAIAIPTPSVAEAIEEAALSEFDQLRLDYSKLIGGVHALLRTADPTEHRAIGALRNVMVELGHYVPDLPF